MAIIKCKMCGGDIELAADKTYGMCEFCGNMMTLPKIDDDQRAAAFNRGNHFRRIGEFDKALTVYERIVREDDTDAEAHWCCALCRFGIEYVEDPATYEWMPTCHRASFDSFLEDVDYKAALEYSDGITKRQYMKEGAKIAEVQRGILSASQNTEPYDVFICYKETDEHGERTRDSLLAQDIYYQLTEQGRKVFFARITLEDVAGAQYEPYIFAALNSAKVMVAVGTKPEYLNAVWVKNEWSRFVAMMKKDRHKLLLPCYRDMDPYDLPEQLAVLQSFDMGKIGFIQDLTRGISKVLDADRKPETVKETVVVQQPSAVPAAPLLQRAFMFLEDADWESADQYCEKVLDLEPQNAMAYVGKLMVDLKVKVQKNLIACSKPFDGNANYVKALRFADASLRKELEDAVLVIKNRILDREYKMAVAKLNNAANLNGRALEVEIDLIIEMFRRLGDYKDSSALIEKAKDLYMATEYRTASVKLQWAVSENDLILAIEIFKKLGEYKDSQELISQCKQKIKDLHAEKKYTAAIEILESAISEEEFSNGLRTLEEVSYYKDAQELKDRYEAQWAEMKESAAAYWNEYTVLRDKLELSNRSVSREEASAERLEGECTKAEKQLLEVEKQTEKLASFTEQQKGLQAQIDEAENELKELGLFAFSQKKEISAKIKILKNRQERLDGEIGILQSFLKINESVDDLKKTISAFEEKIKAHTAEAERLNEELASCRLAIAPVVEKLNNRQIIAFLAQKADVLPELIDEHSVAMTIKVDKELRDMIKSGEYYYLLPKAKQKSIFGKTSDFDIEAVYFQACQAMDDAKSLKDIRWAMEQFQGIVTYKDSAARIEICRDRLK